MDITYNKLSYYCDDKAVFSDTKLNIYVNYVMAILLCLR